MTLSLGIVLLMSLVVLPALLWAFFCAYSNQTHGVEISGEYLKKLENSVQIKKSLKNHLKDHEDHKILMTDFKSMLTAPLSHDYCGEVVGMIKIYPVHGKTFRGYDLWQVIHNSGFILQESPDSKRFFHYYNDARTQILFSLMPLSAPYEFIMSDMGQFETEGLMLLLYDKNGVESMTDMAQLLAEELEGRTDIETRIQKNITTSTDSSA